MKAPYSPDSLQNTLNSKEEFSFNRSKRKEINPYTSRIEKTLTFCGKHESSLTREMSWIFFWCLLGPYQVTYWFRLTTDFMQSSTACIPSPLQTNSDLQVGYITWKSPASLNGDNTMLLGFYFQFHVCFCDLFQSLTFSNSKPSWDTAYHDTTATCEEFPAQCHKTHWVKMWPRRCSQKGHPTGWIA